LYRHPQALWLLFGLLMYWISRIWMLAFRGQMHDDPIVFAIRDKVSWLASLPGRRCCCSRRGRWPLAVSQTRRMCCRQGMPVMP
ncbi:MAG: hypothetical protein AAGL98_05755, partial [Planctomycetota bacterium]